MESKRLKPLKVEAIANGSKRLIDALEVTTTNSKFISLSSPVQRGVKNTSRYHTFGSSLSAQASSISKMEQKIDPCS